MSGPTRDGVDSPDGVDTPDGIDTPDDVSVRTATREDRLGVSRVLDGAMLSVPALPERLAAGDVLVAVDGSGDDERILGAIVVAPDGPRPDSDDDGAAASSDDAEGDDAVSDDASRAAERQPASCPPDDWHQYAHVTAIAVRTRRRDRGIGSALVHAAVARFGPLVVDFDRSVRPFYESLDAAVRPAAGDRCWALLEPPTE